jgi:hypothetical protein
MSVEHFTRVPHDKLILIIKEMGLDERVIPYFEKSPNNYATEKCPFLITVAHKYGIPSDTVAEAFEIARSRGWVTEDSPD